MKSDFDGDIKIYQKKSDIEAKEFAGLAKDIDYHKANGNAQKAVELGKLFAQIKPETSGLGVLSSEEKLTAPILYQARVLITFLCGRAARENIKPQILCDLVRNSMYDYLKEHENRYYRNIADGTAFSFYRLALKKPFDKEAEVGSVFAKMCAAKNDASLIALGSRIYTNTLSYTIDLIKNTNFQEINQEPSREP